LQEKFLIKIANRPTLVLKADFGFVGSKSPGAAKAEIVCNRSTYEIITVEAFDNGTYFLKGRGIRYSIVFIA
jgi:hypothetical protein